MGLHKSTNLCAKETVFAKNNFFKRNNVKSIARKIWLEFLFWVISHCVKDPKFLVYSLCGLFILISIKDCIQNWVSGWVWGKHIRWQNEGPYKSISPLCLVKYCIQTMASNVKIKLIIHLGTSSQTTWNAFRVNLSLGLYSIFYPDNLQISTLNIGSGSHNTVPLYNYK